MKKIISLIFIAVFAFILVGCTDKVSKDVTEINDFIVALPEEVTIELENDINEKISLYDNLSKDDKALVTSYQKLVAAKNKIIDLKNEVAAQIIITLIAALNEEVSLDEESKYLDIKTRLDAALAEVILKVTNKASFDSKYAEYLELKEGPSDEDQNKATAVDMLIEELPVEITVSDKVQIQAARSAYGALTAAQKDLVTKLNLLVAKEGELINLEKEVVDKEKANDVDILIEALPESLGYEDFTAVESARSAYTALSEDQKTFVEKIAKLKEKELEKASLINNANINANVVIGLINDIPSPVKTSDKTSIDAARNAYDALNEYEKGIVTNYNILVEKELEYNNLPASELTYEQRVEKSIEKITTNFSDNLYVSSDLDFYLRDVQYGAAISWTTNNLEVVDSTGVYTAPLFDTDLVITYTATLRNASQSASIAVMATAVSTEEKWEMIETFLKYINKDRIENTKYTMFGYEAGYEENPGEDLGFLMFYTGANPEIIEDIVVGNPNVRTNIIKESTEWIVIHDTGSGSPSADAYMHNNYIKSIAGSSKSWHYTVGDDRIYHHLPNDEVSWNAGDGSLQYSLLPTGVKVISPVKPVLTIEADGYFYLDNRKTEIIAPTGNIGQILTNADINSTGLHVEVGEDGYYYMAASHFGSYGKICNTGGNRNSVSMETCVNAGSDYMMTMRKAAALTAMLLIDFDLLPERVRQHQTFSGKDCPQAIRTAGKWDEFMYMVNVEYYGRKYLSDVTFEYLPKGNYFDSLGMVVNHPGNQTSITYDVKVTYGAETRKFTYSSVIAGRAA